MTLTVGITGTQRGATREQLGTLTRTLLALRASELHHGDCIGADAQAHQVAVDLGLAVVIHPPLDAKKRAHCTAPGCTVLAPRAYLDRNQDIVDASGHLVALPQTMHEQARSGTWATVRYARRLGMPITMIWPDGTSDP